MGHRRDTSVATYHAIKAEGLIPKMHMAIYEWLALNGPATAREVFRGLRTEATQHTRFTELRRYGVLQELPKRKCKESGRTAIVWDITDHKPGEPFTEWRRRTREAEAAEKEEQPFSDESMKVLRALWIENEDEADRAALKRVVELAKARLRKGSAA